MSSSSNKKRKSQKVENNDSTIVVEEENSTTTTKGSSETPSSKKSKINPPPPPPSSVEEIVLANDHVNNTIVEIPSVEPPRTTNFENIYNILHDNKTLRDMAFTGGRHYIANVLLNFVEFLINNSEEIKRIISKISSNDSSTVVINTTTKTSQPSDYEIIDNARTQLNLLKDALFANESSSMILNNLSWIHYFDEVESSINSLSSSTNFPGETTTTVKQNLAYIIKIIEIYQDLISRSVSTIKDVPFAQYIDKLDYKYNQSQESSKSFQESSKDASNKLADNIITQVDELSRSIDKFKLYISGHIGKEKTNDASMKSIMSLVNSSYYGISNDQIKFSDAITSWAEYNLLQYMPLIKLVFSTYVQMGEIKDPTLVVELREDYLRVKSEILKVGEECKDVLNKYIDMCIYSFVSAVKENCAMKEGIDFQWDESSIKNVLKNPALFKKCVNHAPIFNECMEQCIKKYLVPKQDQENEIIITNEQLHDRMFELIKSEMNERNEEFYKFFSKSDVGSNNIIQGVATSIGRDLADAFNLAKKGQLNHQSKAKAFTDAFTNMLSKIDSCNLYSSFIVHLFNLHPLLVIPPNSFLRVRQFIPIFNISEAVDSQNRSFWKIYGKRQILYNTHTLSTPVHRVFMRETDCGDIIIQNGGKQMFLGFNYSCQQILFFILSRGDNYARIRLVDFLSTKESNLLSTTDHENFQTVSTRKFPFITNFVRVYFDFDHGWDLEALPKRRLLDLSFYAVNTPIKNLKESLNILSYILKPSSSPVNNWAPSLKPLIWVDMTVDVKNLNEKDLQSSPSLYTTFSTVVGSKLVQCGINKYQAHYMAQYNRFLQSTMSGLFYYNFDKPVASVNGFAVFPVLEKLEVELLAIYKELGKSAHNDIPFALVQSLDTVNKGVSTIMFVTKDTLEQFNNQIPGVAADKWSFVEPLTKVVNLQIFETDLKDNMTQLREKAMKFVNTFKTKQAKLFIIQYPYFSKDKQSAIDLTKEYPHDVQYRIAGFIPRNIEA